MGRKLILKRVDIEGQRIAVFRMGALGDTLLFFPLLRVLGNWNPLCLDWIVDGRWKSLLTRFSGFQRILSAEDVGWWKLYGELEDGAVSFPLPRYDHALLFARDPEGRLARNMEKVTGARTWTVDPLPGEEGIGHVVDVYLNLLEGTGMQASEFDARFVPTDPDLFFVRKELGFGNDLPLCWSIHPGSGSPGKNMGVDIFARLADMIEERGHRLLVILGPAEMDRAEEIQNRFGGEQTVFALNWPLERLAAAMTFCRGYIGNDSGITHLAGLLRLPGIAFFKSTSPEMWGPLGKTIRCLNSDSTQEAPGILADLLSESGR